MPTDTSQRVRKSTAAKLSKGTPARLRGATKRYAPAHIRQVLPLGPTMFDAGINRDGRKTYVVHGYAKVDHTNAGSGTKSFDGRITPPIGGLLIDHAQATLNISGFAATSQGSIIFRKVQPEVATQRDKVDVNYTLSIKGPGAVTQLQYTLFLGSQELSPWPSFDFEYRAGNEWKDQHGHKRIKFSTPFKTTPIVNYTIMLPNTADPPTTRGALIEINPASFVLRTDRADGAEIGQHYICYVAFAPK